MRCDLKSTVLALVSKVDHPVSALESSACRPKLWKFKSPEFFPVETDPNPSKPNQNVQKPEKYFTRHID